MYRTSAKAGKQLRVEQVGSLEYSSRCTIDTDGERFAVLEDVSINTPNT
jgi:hypothetical protein